MNSKSLIFAALLFCWATPTFAQDDDPSRGQPIRLFDGESLNGWTKQDGSAIKKNRWMAIDGTLHRAKKGAGHIYTEHWYKDFELTFEWKIAEKSNSGVKYRVTDYDGRALGCEFQLIDGKGPTKTGTGALYALYAPDAEARQVNPVGQWNTAKIVVCGNRIEHWLNGVMVVEAEVGSPDWLERVANSKFNEYEAFGQNRLGRIMLQDHGHPVWFREIVLTPLVCED